MFISSSFTITLVWPQVDCFTAVAVHNSRKNNKGKDHRDFPTAAASPIVVGSPQ